MTLKYPHTTACECPAPGWCSRHSCAKSDLMHRMCQTDPRFFALWEEDRGPGQHVPPRQKPCRERGDQLGEEICESCRGKVRIKVFACDVHGACSLSAKLSAIACCVTCPDYQSAAEVVTAGD